MIVNLCDVPRTDELVYEQEVCQINHSRLYDRKSFLTDGVTTIPHVQSNMV